MMHRNIHAGLASLLLGLICSGCQSIDLSSLPFRDEVKAIPLDSPRTPIRDMVCMWEPAQGQNLEHRPCRGFNARIMFFPPETGGKKMKPMRMNGTIRIHVFDNAGTFEEQQKPIDTFEFSAAEFDQFLMKTYFGAAYELFIPYTRDRGQYAKCELWVEYLPDYAPQRRVYSERTTATLQGPNGPEANGLATRIDRPRQIEVMQASFDTPAGPKSASAPKTMSPGIPLTMPNQTAALDPELKAQTEALVRQHLEKTSGAAPAAPGFDGTSPAAGGTIRGTLVPVAQAVTSN